MADNRMFIGCSACGEYKPLTKKFSYWFTHEALGSIFENFLFDHKFCPDSSIKLYYEHSDPKLPNDFELDDY